MLQKHTCLFISFFLKDLFEIEGGVVCVCESKSPLRSLASNLPGAEAVLGPEVLCMSSVCF